MGLLIFIPFIIRNYIRATAIKLSGWLWAFYTLLAMFVASIIGGIVELIIMMYQDPAFTRMLSKQGVSREEMTEYMQKKQTILSEVFIVVSAIGGYLFIRHLLIKRGGGEEQQA